MTILPRGRARAHHAAGLVGIDHPHPRRPQGAQALGPGALAAPAQGAPVDRRDPRLDPGSVDAGLRRPEGLARRLHRARLGLGDAGEICALAQGHARGERRGDRRQHRLPDRRARGADHPRPPPRHRARRLGERAREHRQRPHRRQHRRQVRDRRAAHRHAHAPARVAAIPPRGPRRDPDPHPDRPEHPALAGGDAEGDRGAAVDMPPRPRARDRDLGERRSGPLASRGHGQGHRALQGPAVRLPDSGERAGLSARRDHRRAVLRPRDWHPRRVSRRTRFFWSSTPIR